MGIWEGIKTAVNKVVKRVAEYKDEKEQEQQEVELLTYWKRIFEQDRRAKQEWDERFDRWEAEYNGSREFDNISDPINAGNKKVRTVINFVRMIVEALLDLNVPKSDFRPVARDDEQAVESLKSYVEYVIRASKPSIEEINLNNERRVLKFGGAFWKVHWNNNIKRAGYVGDIEISMPHPKDIIPNHAATSIDDMEHYHHVTNRTAKYILRKWPYITKEELENKAALYREYDEIIDSQQIPVTDPQPGDKESGLEKYTIIETTYRDEDGDVCKLWWSGDLLIKHLPKFYYRRDDEGNIITTEVLEAGTEIRAGIDESGNPVFRMLEQDTEVEYYIPRSFDLIYQPYIPRDKCFWGISIMEDIHDPFESIKKFVYITEEKFLRGDKKIVVDDEELKNKLLDPLSEIIVAQNASNVKTVDFGGTDGIMLIEKWKEWLQLLTGSTNAVLGVHDPGVKSGKQAQTYIDAANFKVAIKSAYKAAAYRQLYRVIADFALAFADYDRPYRLTGKNNEIIYGTFNRLNMLRDMNGNYIWPDFDIENKTGDAGWMQQKGEIFENITILANNGRFEPTPGNIYFLKILQKLGVPYLDDIIESMEADLAQMQMQAPPGQPLGLPPGQPPETPQPPMVDPQQMAAMLMQFPPDIQQKLINLAPEELGAFFDLPPDVQVILAQQQLDDIKFFLQATPNEQNQMLQEWQEQLERGE